MQQNGSLNATEEIETCSNLGVTLMHWGRNQQALAIFERVLQLQTDVKDDVSVVKLRLDHMGTLYRRCLMKLPVLKWIN